MTSSFSHQVEPSSPGASAGRPYGPPTLVRLGTLAELTQGLGGPAMNDALGDNSDEVGSI